MDLYQIIILALIQGITEFLPISSSAHLVLIPKLTHWSDQGLAFDILVHLGTLTAVMHYFRHDLMHILHGSMNVILKRQVDAGAQLALLLVVGTIPAALAGLLLNDWIEQNLRSLTVIAWASIGFGLLLWLADQRQKSNNDNLISIGQALFIGGMQALALIPGTSRSGITMTAALLLGLNRQFAAKFSMLLAIPLIIAASGLLGLKAINADLGVSVAVLGLGFGVSAVSAWLAIHLLMQFVQRIGMLPFVLYRMLLGIGLLVFFT